ncbi:[pyruvate dehydrogenase (acetyl-transferring)]-phosphatase [Sarracenia purpurea var. burkii]
MDLKPHASGDFSIAVVQANSSLEDQSQVFTSPSATYVGVYDGHGGPEASRFVNRHLFPYIHTVRRQRIANRSNSGLRRSAHRSKWRQRSANRSRQSMAASATVSAAASDDERNRRRE